MRLKWDPTTTEPEVREIMRTLAEEYPFEEAAPADLVFERNADPNGLAVAKMDGVWHVACGRPSLAARGAACALAGRGCCEHAFRTFGILFDCTRGNVITVEHFKYWLRRLAMMGYDLAMIYTKDAYQLPDEPYFGYMRGAYSMAEIREIDAYAQKLGIEIIASIQALGHLEPILRWQAYRPVRDTASVIKVDEPKSYELLEKMIGFWSEALSSRRIHLGMDECHDLGRGSFMNEHGYENQFSLYNRHLARICGICEKLKLKPIIWSDMFFRYANAKQDYYDTESAIPEEVKRAIPKLVRFSYWDYYHRDQEIYETMLRRTGGLNGNAPVMASGVWTWFRFWTDYEMTQSTVRPCIRACRKCGVDELVFTMWGDDGGYCEFDSAFAGLAWAADLAANDQEDEDRAAALFEAVCGTSYRRQVRCGDLCYTFRDGKGEVVKVEPGPLLWDDPLMGIVWRELPGLKPGLADTLTAEFRKLMDELAPYREDTAAGHIDYAWHLARVLTLKLELRAKLERAYAARDRETLDAIAQSDIPAVLAALDELLAAFRTQWKRSFKSYGLELMQIRLGGLAERYRELARVLGEWCAGKIASIPELEVDLDTRQGIPHNYREVATGGFFI